MKKIAFRESQLAACCVLDKIDTICRNQDIRYYVFYGSLIGAVRHKGIIPWDDDIDIMMPRPDYDRFMAYCLKHHNKIMPYKAVDYKSDADYPYAIMRMYDTRYVIRSENEDDYGMGVFVDIYPFDGMGNNKLSAVRMAKKSDFYSSMCFLSTRKKYSRDNTDSTARMFVKYPAFLLAKLFGKKFWLTRLEKAAGKYSYEKSRYVGTVMWLSGAEDEVYERSWLKECLEMPFENIMVTVPKEYDKILRHHYGEYMAPPDEKGRKPHHDYETFYVG